MKNKKEYDDVDKSCLVEIFDKSMRENPKRKVESHMLAVDDLDFVLFSPPTPKRQATDPALF